MKVLVEKTDKYVTEPQGDSEEIIKKRGAFWQQRQRDAESNQTKMFQKYNDWYGFMYSANNTSKMALWRSKAFLPIIAGKTWDLVARFIQYKPSWEVSLYNLPVNMEREELQNYLANINSTYDKIKMKMDYDYNDPLRPTPIREEHFSTLTDAIVCGTGIARVTYNRTDVEHNQKQADAFGHVGDVTTTTTEHGYNDYESINIFNFFPAPDAKNVQNARWLVVRDTATKEELMNRPEYDTQVIESIQFDKLNSPTAQYEQNKRRFEQSTDPLQVDVSDEQVFVYDCWDRMSGMHSVFADSNGEWKEIFREKNPYWHKKYPYVRFVIRQKPHSIWGESIFENSETLQLAMNDLFNHYMDNYNMSDGMLAIEEGSVVEPYTIEPAGEFRYSGEKPTQLRFPEPNPAQLTTIMNQLDKVIESVTISQYASGVPNSSVDSTMGTATGITRLMEAATEKIGMMRSNIRGGWAEVGNMWLMNSQQFMSEDIVHEKATSRGIKAELITPADLQGRFVLRVDESSFEPVSNDQKRANYTAYIANLQAWAAASREQAQANGTTEGIINIDYLAAVERFSELSSENAGAILLEAEEIIQTTEPLVDGVMNDDAFDTVEPQAPNGGISTPETYMEGFEETADASSLGLRGLKEPTPRTVGSLAAIM